MTILARAHTACAVALIAGAAMFATAASAQQFGTADESQGHAQEGCGCPESG